MIIVTSTGKNDSNTSIAEVTIAFFVLGNWCRCCYAATHK